MSDRNSVTNQSPKAVIGREADKPATPGHLSTDNRKEGTMTKKPKVVIMWDDPERQAAVLLGHYRKDVAESSLEDLLTLARSFPEDAAKWLEDAALRGLAALNGQGGEPEHAKRTGRSAGGGKLVKGS